MSKFTAHWFAPVLRTKVKDLCQQPAHHFCPKSSHSALLA